MKTLTKIAFASMLFAMTACDTAPVDSAQLDDAAARECLAIPLCAPGYTFNDKSCRCKKEAGNPNDNGNPNDQCGTNVCGQGDYCCNESCGICAPEGGFCIQIACEPVN